MLGRPGGHAEGSGSSGVRSGRRPAHADAKGGAVHRDTGASAGRAGRSFSISRWPRRTRPSCQPTRWQGKSGLNPYADFVMQTDASIGEVVRAVDELGLAENTLIIVTSDNGCSPQAKFDELLARGHNPSHVFRGHKADIYRGRTPHTVSRPLAGAGRGRRPVRPAALPHRSAGHLRRPAGRGPAGRRGRRQRSFLPALLGTADEPLREAVVHHSINGSFAIRQGPWKLELCPGSGGWSDPRPGRDDTSQGPLVQLYNLAADVGERDNLQDRHPEVVERLSNLLQKYVADGRSTPGPPQTNDTSHRRLAGGPGGPAACPAQGKVLTRPIDRN